MGTGDWNDGMNRVGAGGKARASGSAGSCVAAASVRRRSPKRAATRRSRGSAIGDVPRRCAAALERRLGRRVVPPRLLRRRHAARLDGERRVPDRRDRAELGGALRRGRSGARARRRWTPSTQHLVRRDDRLILLLDAAVRHDRRQVPGYIKGYVPGVRENGGQYTHAALWTVMAFAATRRRRPRGGAVLAAQPGQSLTDRRRGPTLPGRALRGRRRRLPVAAAHRPRRLDLVHRLGRLDVSRRARAILGISARGGALHIDPCIPKRLAGLRSACSGAVARATDRRREPGWCESRRRRVEVDGVDRWARRHPGRRRWRRALSARRAGK